MAYLLQTYQREEQTSIKSCNSKNVEVVIMKILVNAILFVTLVLFATTATALTISNVTINVGDVDEIIAYAELNNSGEQTEIDFIEQYLGVGYVVDFFKDENMGDDNGVSYPNPYPWIMVDQPINGPAINAYAYDFSATITSYFLIKTGNIGYSSDLNSETNVFYSYNTFLYKNLPLTSGSEYNSQYGVIDLDTLSDLGSGGVIDIFKISHISYENSSPVPEPSTLLLFGAGIAGLVTYRRRKR